MTGPWWPEAGETELEPHSCKGSLYGYRISPTCLSRKKRTRIRFNILYNFIASPLIYEGGH